MSKQCLCDVVGCPNGRRGLPARSDGALLPVFYHGLPAEEPRRTLWLNAVRVRKTKGRDLRAAKVCSRHFAPGDYERDPTLSEAFGIPYRRPKLTPTAVPSMTPRRQDPQETSPDSSRAAGDDMARGKPGTSVESPAKGAVEMNVDHLSLLARDASAYILMVAAQADLPRDVATQTSRGTVGHNKAVQVRLSRGSSVGVQVNTTLKEKCDGAAQTDIDTTVLSSALMQWPEHDTPLRCLQS